MPHVTPAVIVLLAAALFLPATARAQADAGVDLPAGTLNAAEVVALFSDRTVLTRTVTQKRESLTYYHPDGEVRQRRDGTTRRGFWRVRDDGRICMQMEEFREKCRIIVREADGGYRKYIVRKNGPHQPTVDYLAFERGDRLER